MTRAHAHRAVPAILTLAALTLAGCGSADEPAESSSSSSTSSAPAASASPSASPTAAAVDGADDPATGIDGTAGEGICQWVTGEQVGTLAPEPLTGPLTGVISTNDTRDGKGKIRRCMFGTGSDGGLILGTITFESPADLETFFGSPDKGITPVPELPQPATFGVYNTPTGVSQSIQVGNGTTVRYITRTGEGDPQAKVVEGKNVPATDHRPALRELYDQLFG